MPAPGAITRRFPVDSTTPGYGMVAPLEAPTPARVRSGSFSPLSYPLGGLWDPSDLTSVSSSGGLYSQLNDLSGTGRHLTPMVECGAPFIHP